MSKRHRNRRERLTIDDIISYLPKRRRRNRTPSSSSLSTEPDIETCSSKTIISRPSKKRLAAAAFGDDHVFENLQMITGK